MRILCIIYQDLNFTGEDNQLHYW